MVVFVFKKHNRIKMNIHKEKKRERNEWASKCTATKRESLNIHRCVPQSSLFYTHKFISFSLSSIVFFSKTYSLIFIRWTVCLITQLSSISFGHFILVVCHAITAIYKLIFEHFIQIHTIPWWTWTRRMKKKSIHIQIIIKYTTSKNVVAAVRMSLIHIYIDNWDLVTVH